MFRKHTRRAARAAFAISFGVPSRPIGWRSMKSCRTALSDLPLFFALAEMRSSSDGDWIVPGQIAFARTPFLT